MIEQPRRYGRLQVHRTRADVVCVDAQACQHTSAYVSIRQHTSEVVCVDAQACQYPYFASGVRICTFVLVKPVK